MSLFSKKPGGSESCRPSTNNGYALTSGFIFWNFEINLIFHTPVCNESFQMVDGYRFIYEYTATSCFTKTGTDAANGKWNGIAIHNHAQCLFVFTFCNMSNIALNINLTGTGQITRCFTISKMGFRDYSKTFLSILNNIFRIS